MRSAFFFICFAVLSRLIPHPPNATAVFTCLLLIHQQEKKANARFACFFIWFISDVLLSYVYALPFDSDALIRLSLFMFLFSLLPLFSKWNTFLQLMCFILTHWVLTNLWVFWHSGFYPFNSKGLFQAYYLALPFLQNQILSESFYFFLYQIVFVRHFQAKPDPLY